jgi:hypothetical protein
MKELGREYPLRVLCRGMRCKDYYEAQKFFEYLLLSGDPEQRSDERRLPSCVAPR